jgi:hypothetical protein
MYYVYANSAYIIHDRNFLSFCRPSLRNLPIATAFKLAKSKASLRPPDNADNPPYQTIQQPTTVQTQPTFLAPRPSFADILRPALQPRKDWMKAQPPHLSDEQTDRVWHQSNDSLFGRVSPTILEIQQQIDNLQSLLQQRRHSPPNDEQQSHQSPPPNFKSRVSRQVKKTNTSDDNLKMTSNQSKRGNKSF